jgi:chaperonin cofactor prefoldin
MKVVKKKLEEFISALEEEIGKREETFETRTDTWQESEKGEEYEALTDILRDMYEESQDWLNDL